MSRLVEQDDQILIINQNKKSLTSPAKDLLFCMQKTQKYYEGTHTSAQRQEQEIVPLFLPPDLQVQGNLKRKETTKQNTKKSQGEGLTLLLFTVWWGRKGARKGRILNSARVFSSQPFEKDFKVYPTLKIRWEVVGLTWRNLQAEAEEETNTTPDSL